MAVGILIKNAEVYSPHPMGRRDVLILHEKIIKIGSINQNTLDQLELEVEIIDGSECYLVPGFIDPHIHIIGGSGECGFAARTPEIGVGEIVSGGTTTVVGCLGADTFTRNMPALLGQAKHLNEEGLTAYIYSGGYPIPPATLTGSVRTDMIMVPEVIGAGEVAIADNRGTQPSCHELVKLIADAHLGGLITNKCGVTHIHMGDSKKYFKDIHDLLREYEIEKRSLYPTHVGRNDQLLKEAAKLTQEGITVDLDLWEEDLPLILKKFTSFGGNLDRVTVSSDASLPSPSILYQQIREVIQELKWPLEKVLPLVTTNTARILQLGHKGKIENDADADIVLIKKDTLEIRDVMARGKIFVRNSVLTYRPSCLIKSNRKIEIYGQKETR